MVVYKRNAKMSLHIVQDLFYTKEMPRYLLHIMQDLFYTYDKIPVNLRSP